MLQTNDDPPQISDRLTAWTPDGASTVELANNGPRSPKDRNRSYDYLANDALSDASRSIEPFLPYREDGDRDHDLGKFRDLRNDYQAGRHSGWQTPTSNGAPRSAHVNEREIKESLMKAASGQNHQQRGNMNDLGTGMGWKDRITNADGSFNLLGRPAGMSGIDLGTGRVASSGLDRLRSLLAGVGKGSRGNNGMDLSTGGLGSNDVARARQFVENYDAGRGGGNMDLSAQQRSGNFNNALFGRENLDYEAYQNRGLDKLAQMNERELAQGMLMTGLQQLGNGLGGGSAGRWWS
jgi:hypothetical protein